MTPQEFDQWILRHGESFPLAMAKLCESANWESTRERWYTVAFASLDYPSACRITDELLRGELKHPAQFELDRLPAVMLEAHRERKQITHPEASEWERDANQAIKTRLNDGKTHGLYRNILNLITKAKDEQLRNHIAHGSAVSTFVPDHTAAVETATVRFRESQRDEDLSYRDAVRCLRCNDSGLVMCWSAKTMRDALEQREQITWTEVGVPCTCNPHPDPSDSNMRINKWATKRWKVAKQWCSVDIGRFDESIHTPSRQPESKDRLILWAQKRRASK